MMTTIKPLLNYPVTCLKCASSKVTTNNVVFQGIHVLADCSCNNCGQKFWFTLPAGHTISLPVKIGKGGNLFDYPEEAEAWLARPLIDSIFKYQKEEVVLERKVILASNKKKAILLNTVDSCYGHVFTKLWNARLLVNKEPDKDVIVLVPYQLAWLVPEGVTEIWLVKAPSSKLDKFLANLDGFVKKELERFDSVALSPAYPHLDVAGIDIESFVKTNRFDLAQFTKATPQITFSLREDRFWHTSVVEFLLYKGSVKLGLLPYFKRYFVWQQNRLVCKTAKLIRQQLADVKVVATGLGRSGNLGACLNDQRTENITAEVEAQWCSVYAGSHIVIGVHGSNMLIPTALAAGFIEILPRYKISNITEDIIMSYKSRYTLFLGRHLDQYVSPSLVAMHIISIIKDFPRVYTNAEQEV